MKSTESHVTRSAIPDQNQDRDADGVQKKHRRNADGNQQQGAGKLIIASEKPKPENAEDEHQAHALQTRASSGYLDVEFLAANGSGCWDHDETGNQWAQEKSDQFEGKTSRDLPQSPAGNHQYRCGDGGSSRVDPCCTGAAREIDEGLWRDEEK